jgi:glutamate/aspartate transport system substrate-binding protein
VADALQVEPYATMLRKDDPQFKQLVDGVIGDMMKSGAFARLYDNGSCAHPAQNAASVCP